MTFNEMHRQGFFELAKEYKKIFFKQREEFLQTVGASKSVRSCLVELYWIMVKEGTCTTIEKLEHKDKIDMWNEAKRLCGDVDKKELINTCKALQAFGQFIQQ